MKITGEAALKASPEQLWEAFNDPVALVHTLPGCQRLETTGEDRYQMTISAGVAAIKGTYDGQVQLLDKVEPSSLRMIASGSGMPGTIEVGVAVNLTAKDGGTQLTYDADATVGGMIGGVSQRMLISVSKRMAAEFFANLDDYIARGEAAPAGAGTAAAGEPGGAAATSGAAAGGAATGGTATGGTVAGDAAAGGAATGGTATGGTVAGDAVAGGAAPTVFERSTPATSSSGELLKGALGGGALVLAGVLVGGLLGRRRS